MKLKYEKDFVLHKRGMTGGLLVLSLHIFLAQGLVSSSIEDESVGESEILGWFWLEGFAQEFSIRCVCLSAKTQQSSSFPDCVADSRCPQLHHICAASMYAPHRRMC